MAGSFFDNRYSLAQAGLFIGGNMRLTVLDDDPGGRIAPSREHNTVYLNGVDVKHAFLLTMKEAR